MRNIQIGNPGWQLQLCLLLNMGYQAYRTTTFPQAAAQMLGGFHQFTYSNGTGPLASYYLFDLGDSILVLVEGIERLEQTKAIVSAQVFPDEPFGGGKVQQQFFQAGEDLINTLESWQRSADLPLFVVGHSYGGAAGSVLTSWQGSVHPNRSVQLLTFGAPSAGDAAFNRSLARSQVIRIMNDDDPVPSLPGNIGVAALLAGISVPLTHYIVGGYCQPDGGILAMSDGYRFARNTPPASPGFVFKFVAGRLTSANTYFGTGHSLEEYARRLSLITSSDGLVSPDLTPPASAAIAPVTNFDGWFSDALGRAVQSYFMQHKQEGIMPVPIHKYHLIPPAFRPKVAVSGTGSMRQYSVSWMGYKCTDDVSRSRAKCVEKWLYRWIRTVLIEETVHDQNITAAWEAFVAQATNPASGILPTMNIAT